MKQLDFATMENVSGGLRSACDGSASGFLAGVGIGLTLTGAGAGVGLFFAAASVGLEYYCMS